MRKSRLLAGLAALAIGATALPAHAQTAVPVTLTNPAGSRTLYVEGLDGSALQALDFGTGRSVPFRVRVVDSAFNRQQFSVSATMTNLYQAPNGSVDQSLTPIASSQVSLGRQVAPLSLNNVKAIVQPVVDTTSRLLDPISCAALGLTTSLLPAVGSLPGGTGCTLSTNDIMGKVTEVTVPIDLNNLPALPLVPQANETGAFTNAEYGLGTAGAGDSRGINAPAATPKQVLSGSTILTTDLGPLQTALSALNTGTALVDNNVLLQQLQATYPALAGLAPSAVSGLVNNTIVTLNQLTLANLLKQTGTYIALPTLDVNVPAGATAGGYKGTLVVTALQ
jgi:hypothetical protein